MEWRPILFSDHARDRMGKRGTTEAEVEMVIRDSPWKQTKLDRFEAQAAFPFQAIWNNKFYATKIVNSIFITEGETIVVITVYVFYS